MLEPIKRVVIRLAKVPPEPHAPSGSPGSIRTFRAGENYWKFVLARWGVKQAAGAAGIVFFFTMSSVWTEALVASPLVIRETAPSPPPSPPPWVRIV